MLFALFEQRCSDHSSTFYTPFYLRFSSPFSIPPSLFLSLFLLSPLFPNLNKVALTTLRLPIILSIHPSLLSLFLLLSFSTLFFLPYFPPCSPVPSLPPVSLSSIYLSFFRSFHLHAVKLEVIIYQRAVDVNAGRRTIKCRLQV